MLLQNASRHNGESGRFVNSLCTIIAVGLIAAAVFGALGQPMVYA